MQYLLIGSLNMIQLIAERNSLQVMNMLACWIEDQNSEAFKLHIPRVYDYLWIAEDGMKMQVSTISSMGHFFSHLFLTILWIFQ